jgi:hypothetical protein
MLNALQSSLIVAGSISLALLLQWQLRRVWLPQSRKPHNVLDRLADRISSVTPSLLRSCCPMSGTIIKMLTPTPKWKLIP